MDTKTVHKQPQELPRGGELSGGVYKNFIHLLLLSQIYPRSSKIDCNPPLIA